MVNIPMNSLSKFFLSVVLILLTTPSFAADNADLYTFTSPHYQKRFYNLTSEFRCLICQNQTLADSNAPFAEDMRKQILMMINAGATDQEVSDFLVKRYGEFVRYQPPFNPATYVLWITPAVLLTLGVLVLFFLRQKVH
jgi:cytochrome c-type biogenesis protein CcmH